jgi:hypothetical protein
VNPEAIDDEFEEALMDAFDGELPSDPPTAETLAALKAAIGIAADLDAASTRELRRSDYVDFAIHVVEAFPGVTWDAHKIHSFRQAIRHVVESTHARRSPATITEILLARRQK